VNLIATLPSRLAAWRDPAFWSKASDIVAVLIALSLPWSTSLVGIFGMIFVLTLEPTIEWRSFIGSLQRPISALPIALFALAVAGMLWSDAPWGVRSYAVGQVAKLLMLPLLIYHFQRSARGVWVFWAFLVSCVLMMLMSWLVMMYPGLALKQVNAERGIFVKNYINQSQEFALCAVVLVYPIYTLLRTGRTWQALLLAVIAVSFIVNMAFVVVSRTVMVTLPVMLAVFALIHLPRRASLMIFGATIVAAGLAWTLSPQLRDKVDTFVSDYREYRATDAKTSIGLRLEYWRKSLMFVGEAPFVGHGTGSTEGLFKRAAVGTDDFAAGVIINNPHNQTLNAAVQWGCIGIVMLYAVWLAHLLLFRGEGLAAWIGLMVVVQNIFTSLFNSHLFDFHEGWMYVLGVGVAAGMVLRTKPAGAAVEPAGAVKS
jgi:hypothetical protein